jgi:fucose 4-O-acetylase-like acetyltransferase
MTTSGQQPAPRIRLDYVTIAKGLAIILVVWGHVEQKLFDSPQYDAVHPLNFYLVTFIYSFHMPLFFILTGILAGLPGSDFNDIRRYPQMLRRRSLRLVVPYMAVSLIQVPLKAIAYEHIPLAGLPREMLKVFYEPSGQLWFVYVLFFASLAIPLIEAAFGRRFGLAVVALAAASVMVVNYPSKELALVLRFSVHFLLGIWIGRVYAASPQGWDGLRRLFWPSLAIFVISSQLHYLFTAERLRLPDSIARYELILWYTSALSGSLVCMRVSELLLSRAEAWYVRWLKVLGDYSYDIYLWHFMLVWTLTVLLRTRGLPYAVILPAIGLPSLLLPLWWGRLILDHVPILAFLCRGQWRRK